VGKNNRFQLGRKFNENSQNEEIFDKYQTAKPLEFDFDSPVSQVHAGKFHNLFLTKDNRLFGLGYNKYGQVGISNSLYLHAEEPVEIFTDGVEIAQVAVGSHHNLVLGRDGRLYGFGARMNG